MIQDREMNTKVEVARADLQAGGREGYGLGICSEIESLTVRLYLYLVLRGRLRGSQTRVIINWRVSRSWKCEGEVGVSGSWGRFGKPLVKEGRLLL